MHFVIFRWENYRIYFRKTFLFFCKSKLCIGILYSISDFSQKFAKNISHTFCNLFGENYRIYSQAPKNKELCRFKSAIGFLDHIAGEAGFTVLLLLEVGHVDRHYSWPLPTLKRNIYFFKSLNVLDVIMRSLNFV